MNKNDLSIVLSVILLGGAALAQAQTNIFPASGNVGIGTTSPGVPLQVNGGSGSSTAIRATNNGWVLSSSGTSVETSFGANSGNTYAGFNVLTGGDTAWGNLVLQSGGGNVGIGTTKPLGKLHIDPGNVSTLGAFASSAINIENYSGINNASQIGFGYSIGPLTNTTAFIALIETNNSGYGKGDLIFGTRDVLTDTVQHPYS